MKILVDRYRKKDEKPPMTNLIEKKRLATDTIWIFIFLGMLTMWIYCTAEAFPYKEEAESIAKQFISGFKEFGNFFFNTGMSNDSDDDDKATMIETPSSWDMSSVNPILQALLILSLFALVAGELVYFTVLIIYKYREIFIRLMVVTVGIVLIGLFYVKPDKIVKFSMECYKNACIVIPMVFVPVAIALYFLVRLIYFREEEEEKPSEQQQPPKTRDYHSFPTLKLFLLACIPIGLMYIFVYVSVKTLVLSYTQKTLFFTVMVASTYIINFMRYLLRASMSQYRVILWHKKNISNSLKIDIMFESFDRILQFHLGTISFASTMVLPMGVSIYHLIKYKWNSNQTIWNRLAGIILMPFLAIKLSGYSVISTGLQGHGFLQASKEILPVIMKNSASFLGHTLVYYILFPMLGLAFWYVEGMAMIAWNNFCPSPSIYLNMDLYVERGRVVIPLFFYIILPISMFLGLPCQKKLSCELIDCDGVHDSVNKVPPKVSDEKPSPQPAVVDI